jgi:ABC-type nitrate/sulfonate/bicarbonate transport system substrate-binding protein
VAPRRSRLSPLVLGALAAVLGGCGLPRAPSDGPPPDLPLAPVVKVGASGSVYDAAILLAARRGYFLAEGLAVEIVSFPSLAAVLPPVVAGQLDAGTVSPSVDLFEALARPRGAPRVVASAGEATPGLSPAAFVLRADLAGLSPAQMRGRALGVDLYGPGGRNLALALARWGMRSEDLFLVDLPPERAAEALADSQLDAAYVVEPDAAALVSEGRAAPWLGVGDLDPGQEMALLLYSPNLVTNRNSIGGRLIAAYLRAQESYRAAIESSEGRAALRAELALALGLDQPRSGEELNLLAYPPSGEPRLVSLSALQEYYSGAGLLGVHANLVEAVDLRFPPPATGRPATAVPQSMAGE